jgi:hypothetical protein
MEMTPATVAGLLFVIHPAVDESLTCVLFGPNIPGLFGLLAACLIGMRLRDEARPGRRILALAGLFGFLLFSMASNLIFAIAAPLVCGLVLIRRLQPHELRRLLVPYGVILGAGVSFAALRLSAQGTLGTAMPSYQNIDPTLELASVASFFESIWDQGIRLEPSSTAHYAASMRNSTATNVMQASHPPGSATADALIVVLIGVVVLVLWFSGRRMHGVLLRRSVGSALFVGLVLFLACALPYLFFLGRMSLNRYLYPSLAGLSILGVVMLVASLRMVIPSSSWRRSILLLLAGILAFPMLREASSAVRSIRAAHVETRSLVTRLSDHLDTHRRVQAVGVLDFPRGIGRSGYTYLFSHHVASMLRVLARHPLVMKGRLSLVSTMLEISAGRLSVEQVAAFQYEADGSLTQLALEDLVASEGRLRSLIEEHRSEKSHAWAKDLLHLPDPWIVKTVLEVLLRDGHRGRMALLEEMRAMTRIEPVGEVVPVDAHAGLVANLDQALRQIIPVGWTLGLAGNLSWSVRAESLVELSRQWPRRTEAASLLLERAAVRPADFPSALQWEQLGMPDPGGPSLEDRLKSERRARALVGDASTAEDAIRALDQVRQDFQRVGVQRPDLALLGFRTGLAVGWRSSSPPSIPAWARRVAPLESELAALKRSDEPWALAIHTHVVLSTRNPAELSVLVHILNEDERILPGGVSSYAGRLIWRWQSESGKVRGEVVYLLPGDGVPGSRRRLIPCALPLPERPGNYDLRLELSAFGRTLADVVVREGFSVPHR